MTDTTEVGNQLRLDLLREALPYIRRFKGKTFVVKLSGKVTEDRVGLRRRDSGDGQNDICRQDQY